MKERAGDIVILIPTYNNAGTLGKVITETLTFNLPIWVVNDGSTDETPVILSQFPQINIISYKKNRGKGYALKTGLEAATKAGFRYAITLDSDGQHFPEDISIFLKAINEHPDSLLVGARNLTSENMPGKNTFANKFSNFWFRLETGIRMEDTQSGFRLYPLHKLKNMRFFTPKYEFELEVLVRAAWKEVDVKNISVRVFYPPAEERVSHFRPLQDFTRISILNSILVTIAALWYWPLKCIRSCTRENIKKFIVDNILASRESNTRITFAIMFGVFMGIVPLWGYQMLTAVAVAHLMKMNKALVLVASNISIPPVIPFILFGSYATGGYLLNYPMTINISDISFELLKESLFQYLLGSIIFAIICASFTGIICITILSLFRRHEPITQ